ncbi:MAG: invasin domain 3-containing protein, partial [Solirubrobacteraceae bacterium]
QDFASNAPIEQLTMAQIGTLLTEQSAWAANTSVSGYIEGDKLTITNSGSAASEIPLTGVSSVGSSYGGIQSGWTAAPVGTSTLTSSTTWPAGAAVTVSLLQNPIVASGSATTTATATVTSNGNPATADTVAFSSSDSGEKVSATTNNGNGTYTATITSSTTVGTPTITATDSSVSPSVTGTATLTQTAGPPSTVTVSLLPTSIAASGTAVSTATATVTDAQGHPVTADKLAFTSTDSGQKISAATSKGNGTYTATITSSKTVGTPTITATDSSASPSVTGTAKLTQTAPVPPPSVFLLGPTIVGTATVGSTLIAFPGLWLGTGPITYAYQWQLCSSTCSAISGATGATYKLVTADQNDHVRLALTAANPGGSTVAYSAEIGPVKAASLTPPRL